MKKLALLISLLFLFSACDQLFNAAGPPTNKGYSEDKDWHVQEHPDGDDWYEQRQREKW